MSAQRGACTNSFETLFDSIYGVNTDRDPPQIYEYIVKVKII
jgi:hypothetical protein